MVITTSSVISSLISCSLFTLLAWIILKSNHILKYIGKYIYFFLIIIIIRIILPYEFMFTITIASNNILPLLGDILISPITLGNQTVLVYHIITFLWVVGIAIISLIKIKNYTRFFKVVNRCPAYSNKEVDYIIDSINNKYKKRKQFKVLFVPVIRTPAIFGFFHPKILMPETSFTNKELYYVLSHEILHYYQGDILVKLLCEILCTIYWWNPAMVLLKTLMSKVLEINIDCSITAGYSESEKISYVECLLKVAKEKKTIQPNLILSFSSSKNTTLKQRFICILDDVWMSAGIRRLFIILSFTMLFFTSVSFIFEPYYSYNENMGNSVVIPTEDAYLIKKEGYYEVYINNEYTGTIENPSEPFAHLEIYTEETLPYEE